MSKNNKKSLQYTILSLSIVTVMAGAAVSPALGQIKAFYSDANPVLIQMISSLPALFIVISSLLFSKISRYFDSKTLAILGLLVYVIGGTCGGLTNSIYTLLMCRAIIGIGVGLVMPLSTGLLGYYFSPEEQSSLMGYSSAMNNFGAIIAMSISGFISSYNWRYSFLVYLIGLIIMLLVVLFLPKAKIGNAKSNDNNTKDEKSRGLIYFGMFISQVVFYIFITNFSVIAKESGLIPASQTGVMMSVQAVGAFILSMNFGRYNKIIGDKIKYIGALAFAISYILLAYANNYGILIIGLLLNGIALGTLVPYFNTIALKGLNKEETPDIMSVMSACQYLGQFASPLILSAIMMMIGSNGLKMPYIIGTALCVALALLLIKTKAIEK